MMTALSMYIVVSSGSQRAELWLSVFYVPTDPGTLETVSWLDACTQSPETMGTHTAHINISKYLHISSSPAILLLLVVTVLGVGWCDDNSVAIIPSHHHHICSQAVIIFVAWEGKFRWNCEKRQYHCVPGWVCGPISYSMLSSLCSFYRESEDFTR